MDVGLAEWLKAPDCKPGRNSTEVRIFHPTPQLFMKRRLDESFSRIGFLKSLYGPDFDYEKHAGIRIAYERLYVDKNGQIQIKKATGDRLQD